MSLIDFRARAERAVPLRIVAQDARRQEGPPTLPLLRHQERRKEFERIIVPIRGCMVNLLTSTIPTR